jgi:hypothetical protein
MSLHFIGQRFMVSRGGCWRCVADCRSRLAEVLTFSKVAYNGQSYAARVEDVRGRVPYSGCCTAAW